MQLQEQPITLKFAGGIETKMDSKAVPLVRLLGLENGVFSKAVSIKKRNGYTSRARTIDGSTSLVTGTRRNAVRDNEYLLFTNNKCYSQQSGADKWTDVGAVICAVGSDRPAVHTSTAQTVPDHATLNGVTAYAWEDSRGGVWWSVVDTNGHVYRAPAQADSGGQRPRCVVNGEVIHIYFAVPAQRQIKAVVVNPSVPTATVSPVIVVEDLDTTNPVFDAVPTTRTGTPSLIAWHEHATTNIRIGFVTAGATLGSPASGYPPVERLTVGLGATSPLALDYFATDDTTVLAYVTASVGVLYALSTGTASEQFGADFSTAQTVYAAPVSVQRVTVKVVGPVGPYAYAVFEEAAAQPTQRYSVITKSIVQGALLSTLTLRSVGLASRAFQAGASDDAFAVFVHDSTYFNTYLTLRLADAVDVGRHLPGSAAGPTRSHLPSAQSANNIVKIALPYKTRLVSLNNDKFTESGVRLVTMDFDNDDSHQCVQIGRGLYMAAACPQHFDGASWTEQGFHMGPEYIPAPTLGSGGALTTSVTYGYKFWYEWTDRQGEVHRGPESVTLSVATGGSDTKATFLVPTLRVTRKENVRLCVARSLPGDTSEFYRVSSLDPTTAGADNGYLANSKTVDSVTFVDAMSDADLRKQEKLYTTGGILSNDPAPLGSLVCAGKGRLFYTDAQNGSVVRFSQRIADGYGLEVAPELAHDVDPEGGDITALAYMDDVIYAFKRSMIWAFNGDGPYENGQTTTSGPITSGFSKTQKISPDIGCSDPSSIVVARDGIYFKSEQGIHLLKRSREVVYIGAPVEAHNAQTVRRAVALPKRPAVIFLTDSGKSLYFDYQFGQWSTFTNHEGYDAAVVDGVFQYLRTNDVVFREDLTSHSDAGSHITLRLETAWIHMVEHLQGFQRFWRMLVIGTWSSPHQLGMQYRMSYDEAWTDASWFDATGGTDATGWLSGEGVMTIGQDPLLGSNYGDGNYGDGVYGGTGPDIYQWRYGIFEGGQSIQFRFEDFEKAGLAGASFELTEMTIIGGVMKPDVRPFSAARSY